MHTGKGFIMLHHLAGANIQVAKLVNYKCHSHEAANKKNLDFDLLFSKLFLKTTYID